MSKRSCANCRNAKHEDTSLYVVDANGIPTQEVAEDGKESPATNITTNMYRMYNQYTGEHLYTASTTERNQMQKNGWTSEGVMWQAPKSSNTPIYRLYNPYTHAHFYTADKSEVGTMAGNGWYYEDVAWVAPSSSSTSVYRLCNRYMSASGGAFSHLWTQDQHEAESLKQSGWREESGGWYGLKNPSFQTATDGAEAFSKMAGSYVMASGMGGWSDQLTVNADGTFEGSYSDSSINNGRREWDRCNYRGQFGSVLKIDSYTYVTSIKSLTTLQTPGSTGYVDGAYTNFIEPYGMMPGGTISFYLKGKSASSTPSLYKSWVHPSRWNKTSSLPFRGLYNNVAGYSLGLDFVES